MECIFVLDLPNGASVSREMDHLLQTPKGRHRAKTLSIFSNKLTNRSKKIIKCQKIIKDLNFCPSCGAIQDVQPEHKDISNASLDIKKSLKDLGIIMKSSTLGNDYLVYIVNGCKGELLKDRPYDFKFTEQRILKSNAYVGYVLFTRACLKIK